MHTEEMRIKLIESAIHTISNVGVDRATTKLLAGNAGLNEVYIYRIFGGKDGLFKESFTYIDKQFAKYLLKCFKDITKTQDAKRDYFRKIFSQIWKFALNDQEKCSFFIRYYYSRYYTKQCGQERKEIYQDVMLSMKKVFKEESNVWWLFNHMFDVIFSSAVKVLREEIPDNRQTEENIFVLLYAALQPHLK